MNNKHQKKRNSLLVYEFLVRTISKSLIENDKNKSAAALKIIRRNYKPGTELYKEFRLMNSLVKTTVSSEHVASSILKEAKSASISINEKILDKEKSILIRNINHTLNDSDFYDQHVSEYRTYATVQLLLNEWRSSNKDIYKTGQYEDHLMKHLVSEKKEANEHPMSDDSTGTSRLLMKIMTKKLNEKYNDILNEQQKSLIKAYAYSTACDDQTSIIKKLHEIKAALTGMIDISLTNLDNEFVKSKLLETKGVLLCESLEDIDDATVTRFMLYAKLNDVLESKE